ncbi:hypothetical protein J6590_046270 [Homalodisca vitripennis]|nr:hypothetical protein J6590_046270 [Homalodisca vitripennis]
MEHKLMDSISRCLSFVSRTMKHKTLGSQTEYPFGYTRIIHPCPTNEDDTLREHLASAIANCCSWSNNCYEFGRLGAVTPLVGYMMSKERRVHRTTALALCQLSQDPFNCVTLHQSGVVPYLLKTIGSPDEVLQEASAGCLSNIRKLALASDRAKY